MQVVMPLFQRENDAEAGKRLLLDANALNALAAWRLTKGVYRLHPATLAALWETRVDGHIPSEVLLKLPEWCVYVELPPRDAAPLDGTLYGFWAHLDVAPVDEKPELCFLLDLENGVWPLAVSLGGTVHEGLESVTRSVETMGAHFSKSVAEKRALLDLLVPMVSILLYICAAVPDTPDRDVFDAAEITHLPTRGIPLTQKGVTRAAQEPTWWRVGYRMGQALRGALADAERQREFQNRNRAEGGTVAPHVRRAHWHTYWTGEGSRTNESKRVARVNWIPPVPVNVRDHEEMPATVRPVR